MNTSPEGPRSLFNTFPIFTYFCLIILSYPSFIMFDWMCQYNECLNVYMIHLVCQLLCWVNLMKVSSIFYKYGTEKNQQKMSKRGDSDRP